MVVVSFKLVFFGFVNIICGVENFVLSVVFNFFIELIFVLYFNWVNFL